MDKSAAKDQDKPVCGGCAYFQSGIAKASPIGQCLRFPPTLVLMMQQTVKGMTQVPNAAFPPTAPDAWCGEFRQKSLLTA